MITSLVEEDRTDVLTRGDLRAAFDPVDLLEK